MLALVFGFLSALIQGVFAFVYATRMAWAGGTGQAGDAGGFGSAILAVVVHNCVLVVAWIIVIGSVACNWHLQL